MNPRFVLDTSVAVAWFFEDEPGRRESLRILERIEHAPTLVCVPALFFSELIHVLARKSARDERFVRGAVDGIVRIGLPTIAMSGADLTLAGRWACRGLSGCDATFVALAEALDARWLTADDTAARRVGSSRALTLRAWARTE